MANNLSSFLAKANNRATIRFARLLKLACSPVLALTIIDQASLLDFENFIAKGTTAIIGLSNVTLESKVEFFSSKQLDKLINLIKNSGERLQGLVNDILDLPAITENRRTSAL